MLLEDKFTYVVFFLFLLFEVFIVKFNLFQLYITGILSELDLRSNLIFNKLEYVCINNYFIKMFLNVSIVKIIEGLY